MIVHDDYKLGDPDALETPAMLVFEELVDGNIRTMCELAGGAENLMVHVKTHKAAAITRKKIEAGIAGFKCATLKELEMVLEEGGQEAIMAYPLVQQRKVERFAALVAAYPEARIHTIVSTQLHIDVLGQVAAENQRVLKVMLDLDLGMHRTGVAPDDAAEALYRALGEHQYLEPSGFHMYDGHEHITDPAQRQVAAQRHIDLGRELKVRLEAAGNPVPLMVAGNTFTFPYYARAEGMHGSPGACTYWDINYGNSLPDMPFRWAALVLSQVVDRHPQQQTITTDLGIKAIAGDPPLERRARLLGGEGTELILQNEEHGVFRCQGELPAVGSYVLAVPGHVCPTAIRYPGSYVIDTTGEVIDYYTHTARDRQ